MSEFKFDKFLLGAIESASAQEWMMNNGQLSNPAGPLWWLDYATVS